MSSVNFLNSLLTYESGINELYFDWYLANWDNKTIDYFDVKSTGIVTRNTITGKPERKKISVNEYFKTLGVLEYFDPLNISSLNLMKYRSINPWGFIGYQLGEQALFDCGIYTPKKEEIFHNNRTYQLNVIYVKLEDHTWSDNIEKKIIFDKNNTPLVIATNVNTWMGNFTGKFGINSKEDLFNPNKQTLVIKNLMKYNYNKLIGILEKHYFDLDIFLNQNIKYDNSINMRYSLSGILACCHLCGYKATANLILKKEVSYDEINTSILNYMEKFSDYDVKDIID